MKRTFALPTILIACALCATGCGTAIKTGVNVAMGARGNYMVIEKSMSLLDAYSEIVIEPPTTDMGAACPRAFLDAFVGEVTEQLLKKPHFAVVDGTTNPKSPKKRGKVLVLRAKIIDYSGGSIAGRGIGFGPATQVVGRAQLIAKDTNKILCVANIRGFSKSVAHGGENDLATGWGKGLVKLIRSHHSEIDAVREP